MGESIRDLGLAGQMEKAGTPTMGGFIILASLLIPGLLFAKLSNVYIVLLIITAVWTGLIGFVDDYLKEIQKQQRRTSRAVQDCGAGRIGPDCGLDAFIQ